MFEVGNLVWIYSNSQVDKEDKAFYPRLIPNEFVTKGSGQNYPVDILQNASISWIASKPELPSHS